VFDSRERMRLEWTVSDALESDIVDCLQLEATVSLLSVDEWLSWTV